MGGTCSNLTSIKTSKTFNNRVHTVHLSEDVPDKGDSTTNLNLGDTNQDRASIERHEIGVIEVVEAQDVFSKGDFTQYEKVKLIDVDSTRAGQYVQNDFAQGDFSTEEREVKVTPDDQSCKGEENDKHETDNSNKTMSSEEEENYDNQNLQNGESKDSNGNSYRNQNDIDCQSNISKEGEEESMTLTSQDTSVMENHEETQNQEDLGVPQDSLVFLPLDDDKQPPATYKIPERLNRTRKTHLTYKERMLLADCNRFEQLDKKREFAVRRNRSISRLGRLPKIEVNKKNNSEDNGERSSDG